MKSLRITGPGVVNMRGFPYVDGEGPRGMNDLRVVATPEGFLVSFWQPDAAQLERLQRGMPIVLYVMGGAQPPVALDVAETQVEVEP